MPFEVDPLDRPRAPSGPGVSGALSWTRSQSYFGPDHAQRQISEFRPGSLRGGPSSEQYRILEDPKKYSIFAPAPAITDRANTQEKAFGRFGSVNLSMIDPFMSTQSIAEGLGASPGQAASAAAAPQTFLGSKDIDPFGQGSAGVPSRLFDYATGWLGALYDHSTGKPIIAPVPTGADALQYNFQRDPAYWALVSAEGATDEFLTGVARTLAGRYVSNGDNSYLAEKLLAQLKIDRDRAIGMSSGDRRLDYQAKTAFTVDYIQDRTYQPPGQVQVGHMLRNIGGGGRGGAPRDAQGRVYTSEAGTAALMQFPSAIVGALPFVGADIRENAYQHPQVIEDAWRNLTNEQRQAYFGQAGVQMLLGDVAVWLPLMAGGSAVQAVAIRRGGVAVNAWKAYEYTRNVTVATMATGLTVATVNWALEASVPGYAEDFGKRLDYARPWSQSNLAGLINQMGFFASGTFGGATAARVLTRGAGKALAKTPLQGGLSELSYYRSAFGGSAIRNELAQTGIAEPGLLDLAPKGSFQSRFTNWREAEMRAIYEAKVKLGEMTIEEANTALLRGIDQAGIEAEGVIKAMTEARRPRPIFSGEAQRIHDAAVKLAKYVDDEMARVEIEDYGQAWLMRQAGGEYSSAAMARAAAERVERLGGDPSKLGKHNEEGWGQVLRYLHGAEYVKKNGLLHAVAEGTDEGSRVMLMQADHLFANDVDDALGRLRGDDAGLAQATAAGLIREKREAAAWFASEWDPPAGVKRTPESVPPAELADWLEDVRSALPSRRALPEPDSPTAGMPLNAFHAELEAEGLWVLGFKPVDEAGNAISYVRRGNGNVFKSPWVEYPMGNGEAIELGNRSMLLSKIDGVTRGFRTWRIVEFQKGLLFRRLSGKMDVNSDQIERFHAGVMRLARETGSQPQTLGAVARASSPIWGAHLVQKEIEKLAGDVFGVGVLDKAGKAVNFADEIARSYRQAFRLNLTAGLTSYLKANLGEVGNQIAWASDIGYVMWRFNMSPIFKGGEILESAQFNRMRSLQGVDPLTQSLYFRAGVGNDYGTLAAEMSYDDMVRSLTGRKAEYLNNDPSARLAASEAFHARHIPEDFPLKARIAFEQQTAADMIGVHGGGNLPSADWLPRSPGRVVTPDEIPDDFSIALADHRPDLLDPDRLADEQGIWHATTALDKVYDEGVKARREILATGGPKPVAGEGFLTWRQRLSDEMRAAEAAAAARMPETQPLYRAMSDTEYHMAEKAGGFQPAEGVLDTKLTLTNDPDRLASAPQHGYIVEFESGYMHTQGVEGAFEAVQWKATPKPKDPGAGTWKPGAIDFGARNRVWKWDPEKGDHILIYESDYVREGATQALGGGLGTRVSTTFNEEHALEIALRLKFASRAARNEVTNLEILEHFADRYGDDIYTMGKILGAYGPSFTSTGALKLSTAAVKKKLAQPPHPNELSQTIDDLARWMDTKGKYFTGQVKYEAVKDLDGGLVSQVHAPGEWGGGVILAGSAEDVAKINPAEVGVVQLAARKGAVARDGADQFELEFKSDDLLVVDDRQRLGPLADDEEGLLAQLRATLAEEPKIGQLSIADHMVGGNGIAPGLETRARQVLTKLEDLRASKLDGGPTFRWADIGADEQTAFRNRLEDEGWRESAAPLDFIEPPTVMSNADEAAYARAGVGVPGRDELYVRTRLDGSIESRYADELYDEYQRRPGAADSLDDVAGTPEALFENLLPRLAAEAEEKGWRGRAWDTFKNPAPYKLQAASKLQIQLARAEFPSWLRLSGNDQVIAAYRSAWGTGESRWLDNLIEDRLKLDAWINATDDVAKQAALDDLIGHAGNDANRAVFDELYASAEWGALSALISAGLKSAGQEAFGVHFFSPYRSALERSINHPLLGIYPASWSIKAGREWARFLFNNRTLGIDIGMAPAQAIAQIVHAQKATFAQMTDQDMDEWLESGPVTSPIFIFNLLMPGDWSALPFSASRTIRDYARPLLSEGQLPNAGEVFANNLRTIGVTRDLRLFFDSVGEMGDILNGVDEAEPPASRLTRYSIRGGENLTYDPGIR